MLRSNDGIRNVGPEDVGSGSIGVGRGDGGWIGPVADEDVDGKEAQLGTTAGAAMIVEGSETTAGGTAEDPSED